MTEEQKNVWGREKRAVHRLRDGLGKPVDQAVVPTVVALRLLGFTTTSSCGGHFGRPASPYVALRSPENQADRQRIEGAQNQAEQHRLRELAIQHNAGQLARLIGLVERFYEARNVPQSQRLICQGFGVIGYRLTTQDTDLVHVVDQPVRRELVARQRLEFDAFAEFLTDTFFEQKDATPSRAAYQPLGKVPGETTIRPGRLQPRSNRQHRSPGSR
ncbi:hypothetical protein [Streptomyces microflavus]|uniref:hypothetical protein n=1 Tax=Streptomyces microflavus TaxID=1919 RepID=UPI0036789D73